MKNIFSKIIKSAHNVFDRNKSDKKSANKNETVNKIENDGPADFETAITATSFGKFNILLILIAIPTGWASMFETTTLSYVIPVAHCDLDITLEQKGYLISITYLGMLSSATIWGFLADTYGRKKLIVIGLLLDAIFTLLGGMAQSYGMIMFTKFMGGFIINGPFAVLTSLLSEFHCALYRARVLLSMGIVFSLASIALPLLGMALLSQKIEFSIGFLELHSWNIFLIVSAIPAVMSGFLQMFLPESPKFLMTAGRNEEALQVFRKIYSLNTGKPADTFPIKALLEEREQSEKSTTSKWENFKAGFTHMKPLFFFPHLPRIVLVCTIQMCLLMSLNTLRLWLPQIFTAINDYKSTHQDQDASICLMLEMVNPNVTNTNISAESECYVNYENTSVYTNSMIVALASIIGYILVGKLINILGKKVLLVSFGTIASIMGFSIYFAQDSASTIVLSSLFITLCSINTNVLLTIVVDLFPTTLRTMTVSLSMMLGRTGAMTGNIVMPHLLSAGCLPPFLFVGLAALSTATLGLLLPKTDMKALE